MTFLRELARGLASLLAPFLLIGAGAGIAALGMKFDWMWLFWAGLIVAAAGVLWGVILYFYFEVS